VRAFLKDLSDLNKAIKLDKKEYLKKDPSIENSWQLMFHAGFLSLKLYRWSHLFYSHNLKFLAFLLHFISRVLFAIDINPAAKIEPGVVIDHGIGTVIGSTTTIGSGTLIYHGVTLGARNIQKGKRHPDVGKNVLIGSGAKILGPVKIGDNSQIGANAVVLKNVPPNTKATGIPAKIVGIINEENSKIKSV
jgi:serine O-acetyltransferase